MLYTRKFGLGFVARFLCCHNFAYGYANKKVDQKVYQVLKGHDLEVYYYENWGYCFYWSLGHLGRGSSFVLASDDDGTSTYAKLGQESLYPVVKKSKTNKIEIGYFKDLYIERKHFNNDRKVAEKKSSPDPNDFNNVKNWITSAGYHVRETNFVQRIKVYQLEYPRDKLYEIDGTKRHTVEKHFFFLDTSIQKNSTLVLASDDDGRSEYAKLSDFRFLLSFNKEPAQGKELFVKRADLRKNLVQKLSDEHLRKWKLKILEAIKSEIRKQNSKIESKNQKAKFKKQNVE